MLDFTFSFILRATFIGKTVLEGTLWMLRLPVILQLHFHLAGGELQLAHRTGDTYLALSAGGDACFPASTNLLSSLLLCILACQG